MNRDSVFAISILVVIAACIIVSASFLAGVFLLIGTIVLNTHFDAQTWGGLTVIIAVIEFVYLFIIFDMLK